MTPDETLTVRCPQCSGESLWSKDNPYRPFCSKRCKLIDLGAWASESYRVPVEGKLDGENEEFNAIDAEKNGQTLL